jgi:hypothetical protein
MDWKKLLGSIPASVDEEIRLRNAYLVAENRILRQQISGRVQLTEGDRRILILIDHIAVLYQLYTTSHHSAGGVGRVAGSWNTCQGQRVGGFLSRLA